MRKVVVIASLLMLLTSCSKNLIPYTVGIEKKIQGQETAVQYYASSDLALLLPDYQDTLLVNEKGEIERQKSSNSSEFYVKTGTRGVLGKIEEGVYWIKFDQNDDRMIPFVPNDTLDISNFTLGVMELSRRVKMSDQKEYIFRGSPSLRVSQKVISKITQDTKTAKGVKIGK